MTASSTQVGGRPELTRTSLLVSAAEWAELSRPGPELRGFLRDHIQLPGLNWHQVKPGADCRSRPGALHRVP
jgi:N-acyl homoserine lactone hydrolase